MNSYILIKGDISGIQDFIFNVQSKGAAKALKARSFFIEALGWLTETRLKQEFPHAESVYNGGGNFYLKLNSTSWDKICFLRLQQEVALCMPHLNISISLSFAEHKAGELYSDCLKRLNRISAASKLSRYSGLTDPCELFEPFTDGDKRQAGDNAETGKWQTIFRDLTSKLVRSSSYEITRDDLTKGSLTVTEDSISLLGYKLSLTDKNNPQTAIPRHVPLWTEKLIANNKELTLRKSSENGTDIPRANTVIELGYMAEFARTRSGTAKLGVLKLDVDNLGGHFQILGNEHDINLLSEHLVRFFRVELSVMLQGNMKFIVRKHEEKRKNLKIDYNEKDRRGNINAKSETIKIFETSTEASKYADNLYIVFAGGDDCYIIGAWDAIIDFSLLLRKKFTDYVNNEIKKDIPKMTGGITLSASITIIDPHYPVVRFSALAEDALHKAKSASVSSSEPDASGRPVKDRVSFLGRVFRWSEFAEVVQVKDQMLRMVIEFGESRAFLQRIINSVETEEQNPWQKTAFHPSALWRFPYHYRDIRHQKYFRGVFYTYFFGEPYSGEIGGVYKKYLMTPFMNNDGTHHTLPVAARWAEFLTRKK